MTENLDCFLDETTAEPKPEPVRVEQGILVMKYITEIKIYPSGKKFVRSWLIDSEKKNYAKKKTRIKEDVTTVTGTEEM